MTPASTVEASGSSIRFRKSTVDMRMPRSKNYRGILANATESDYPAGLSQATRYRGGTPKERSQEFPTPSATFLPATQGDRASPLHPLQTLTCSTTGRTPVSLFLHPPTLDSRLPDSRLTLP